MVGGDRDERTGVLGKAAPAPSGTGPEERAADSVVGTDALDHVVDVGSNRLAHRRHRVDERDLHGQKAVGGVLDGFGRRRVGEDDVGVERRVEGRHPLGTGAFVAADDDTVGVEEIVHRRALAQELGIGDDPHVVALQHALDHAGRTDRHGGLVDHDRAGPQRR